MLKIFSINSLITTSQDFSIIPFAFQTNRTILDADIIFWNVQKSEHEILPFGIEGLEAFEFWKSVFEKRKGEFQEYFSLGRSLIISSPTFNGWENHYSDSGKISNLIELLPIDKPTIELRTGSAIESSSIEYVQDYLNDVGELLEFNHEFKSPKGIPLMYIKGTRYVVSQYFKVQNGIILFLPNYEQSLTNQSIQNFFLTHTNFLVDNLKRLNSKHKEEIPLWAKTIQILGEHEEKDKLIKLQQQKEELEQRINIHELKIQEYGNLKTLFTSTGNELEEIVRSVFSEIGFQIEEPEKGRDDLIIHHGDFVAVIEAKGIDGSSGEKHAAQLQKWVSAYHEKHEKEPKGILVANTYRKIPLYERTQEDFPHQMLKYVERMGHCLMTGIQLLYLLLDFRRGKLTIEDIATRLSENVGILEYGNKTDYFDNLPN